jgi:anti-sigma28 factor (negative regulator of flagellin synthesis)
MRIVPKVVVHVTLHEPRDPGTAAKAGAPAAASVVKLSSAATAATSARESTGMTGRLERIRALLDKGEYPVDLDQLTSRIVDDEIVQGSDRDAASIFSVARRRVARNARRRAEGDLSPRFRRSVARRAKRNIAQGSRRSHRRPASITQDP